MPTAYFSNYFTPPKAKIAMGELQKSRYVWVGFVARDMAMHGPTDLMKPVRTFYASIEHQLEGGAHFQAMVIRGRSIQKTMDIAQSNDVGLLGFHKAKKWPRSGLVNMDPPELREMLPKFLGHYPSASPNTVTIRSDWEALAEDVGNRLGIWSQAIRKTLHIGSRPKAPAIEN